MKDLSHKQKIAALKAELAKAQTEVIRRSCLPPIEEITARDIISLASKLKSVDIAPNGEIADWGMVHYKQMERVRASV